MENQNHLQRTSGKSIELSNKEYEIATVIYHVNQLVAYPLTELQIEDWAKSIHKILPDLNIISLEALIDDFKQDAVEWDNQKGIQNIFTGLKSYNRKMVY